MIQKTQIPGKDFETEIEQHLNNGAMAYEDHIIAAVPFKSREEEIEFIKKECIIFEDTENYYIAKDDGTGDYGVQVCKKTKYEYLS